MQKGLDLSREMKNRLLKNPPVDPVLLGWQRFYEFLLLVRLHNDSEALTLFLSNEEYPYILNLKQTEYMTSVAAELACNLKKVSQTLKLARLSWAMAFRDTDVVIRIQKAQNACIYFERLKQNRLNFGFARFLTGFGKSNDLPVLYVQGLECLLANFKQSQSLVIHAMLNDSLSELAKLYENPPDPLPKSRVQELIDAINANRRDYMVSGLFEKSMQLLRENRLSELLALINEYPDLVFEFNQNGWTLLMEAIKSHNEETIEILLNHNADIHAVDSELQTTPLLLAVETGSEKISRKLIEAGADPEVKNAEGETCLIIAVKNKFPNIVALLLEYGVLADRFDLSENNALIYAIETNQPEIVKSLIFAGANTNVKNSSGMDIKQIAENSKNPVMVSVLKQFRDE